jgi:dihydrofolate synthase/folylpolyglutamate synthase
MSFEEAQAYLERLGIDAMKHMAPSMTRIEAICEALNHPERQIPAIHITGTNGKTSTARIATSLLTATGLTVGTYTSPHLETLRERITLSGEPISEESFAEMFDHLRPYLTLVEGRLGEDLTYFEVLTALFFLWAAEQPVDVVVVEVGLGGRWDATNVLTRSTSVITNIGFDHTGLLGRERTSIAAEKSGIIKRDSVVVTAERSPDALEIIEREAAGANATVSLLDRDWGVTDNSLALGGRYLTLDTSRRKYEGLFLPIHGLHQGLNAATALEAVTRFLPAQELSDEVVAEGFAKAVIPGRLEIMRPGSDASPAVVIDVAHNPDGMSALVSSLVEEFAFDRLVVVIGILGDKDYEGMLTELARVQGRLFLTEARSVRSVPPPELAAVAERLGLEHSTIGDVPGAVGAALAEAGATDLVCVTGSHYVVGEARSFLAR